MPSFSTPAPLTLHVDVSGLDLRVRATATAETVVDVRPHDPTRAGDVALAERVTVEHVGDHLALRTPRTVSGRLRGLLGGGDRVDVEVTLPEGSALEVRGWGEVVATGALGRVDVDLSMGNLSLDRVERVHGRTGMGDVRIESSSGTAELRTSAGTIDLRHAAAAATARTSAGDVTVGDAHGPLRLTTSAGDIRVDSVHDGVVASASAGDVRVHAAHGGAVHVDSSYGRVEVGVPHGVAAWLDVEARHGAVRSDLQDSGPPADGDPTVEVRVRAGYGDILLRRA